MKNSQIYFLIFLMMFYLSSCTISYIGKNGYQHKQLIRNFTHTQKKEIRKTSTFLSRNVVRKLYFKYKVEQYRNPAFYFYFLSKDHDSKNSVDTFYVFERLSEQGQLSGYILQKGQVGITYQFKGKSYYGYSAKIDSISYLNFRQIVLFERFGEKIFDINQLRYETKTLPRETGADIFTIARVYLDRQKTLKYKIDMLITDKWQNLQLPLD